MIRKDTKRFCLLLITLSVCSSLIYMGEAVLIITYFTGLIVIGIGLYKMLDNILKGVVKE